MSRKHALEPLTDLLVDLYPTEESSRRVVAEAGIHHGRIAFQDAAINNWFAILTEADRVDKVAELVRVAEEEYPDSTGDLSAALETYESATPEQANNPPVEVAGGAQAQLLGQTPGEGESTPDGGDGVSEGKPTKLYFINLCLLLSLTVLLSLWFYLHIYPLVERRLVVGALGAGVAVALMAARKIAATFGAQEWTRENRSRFGRLFGHLRTSQVLIVAVFVALGLAASTSSIYLVHDEKNLQQLTVVVETGSKADGSLKRFTPRPRLHTRPAAALAGGPVFFRPFGETLSFRVESSPILNIDPEQHRLWPWQRLQLRAAVNVKKRPVRVFRVAPGNLVMGRLAEPGIEEPAKTYALEVLWQGESAKKLADLRQGLVYFGDEPNVIAAMTKAETPEQKRQSLEKCAGSGSVQELMEYWDSGSQLLRAGPPSDSADLVIRVTENPSGPEELSSLESVVKWQEPVAANHILTPGIHTICLTGASQ